MSASTPQRAQRWWMLRRWSVCCGLCWSERTWLLGLFAGVWFVLRHPYAHGL